MGSGVEVKTIRVLTTKIQAAGVDTVHLKQMQDTDVQKPVHRVATEPFFVTRFERWE
jgi:hypothetical protein